MIIINNQIPNTKQFPITNTQITKRLVITELVIGYCLVIGAWCLVV
jgi:hypothetical protein